MSRYCKHGIDPMHCAADECQPPAKGKAQGPLGAAACSPLRVAYSRAELADKLKDWMIELWGDSPKNFEPEQRDQWHRDNGMIYHFICDHFPAENNKDG